MSPRLAFAIEIAKAAGASTLPLFRADREYVLKGDRTPVTEADRGAERMIREAIASNYPGEDVLGEEEGGETDAPTRWVVDPIDGTKSFVAGVPLYATLVAFEQEGGPILGVACFPALGEIVYAESGGGCWWNDKACKVKDNTDLGRAVLCCGGHKSMIEKGRDAGLARLAKSALATRTWGDAYGHALVATGRADAMIDPSVARWDVSAMAVIVREAGGSFTDFDGSDVLTNEAVSCIPGLRDQVLGAFRD